MTHQITAALSRRLLLAGMVALPAAALLPRPVSAQHAGASALLLSLADLHSPYARLPQLLGEIDRIRADSGLPVAVAINGDVFERGNVVALRSGGAADLEFLAALTLRGPVILNLGNHETALVDDMATTVARAEGLGIEVIGNIVDARRGRFFAPASTRFALGGMRVGALGLAPTNPFVYRAPVRETLQFLDPAAFAADMFPGVAAGSDAALLLSHAGVMDDRSILPGLPAGSVMVGGHDHLSFQHDGESAPYVHGGSWGGMLTVIGLAPGMRPSVEMRAVSPDMPGDEGLADIIAAQMGEHLTDEERAVIGESAVARDLPASILFATEAVRAATEADVAMLGHTTFGQPIPMGAVTRYDFDACIRFDGDLRVAEVSGAELARILTRANQHRATSLDQRTGDFVHAAEIDIDPAATYRLAVNGWTAMNQQVYLGTDALEFVPVEGLSLKAVVAEALAAS
ncbi:bifunctional metallophosphatase/5'-nucleotidase [Rhodobacterales bacterium HKCCSP123]|nr:bifunctional metallophosphatase/5'-nucleotidase [Rhodobacterales bacterium HKCCSP123]